MKITTNPHTANKCFGRALFYATLTLFSLNASKSYSQKVGVGSVQFVPSSTLDVMGNLTVGLGYAGSFAAPVNGAIFQGYVGIGTQSPANLLHIANTNADTKMTIETMGVVSPQ